MASSNPKPKKQGVFSRLVLGRLDDAQSRPEADVRAELDALIEDDTDGGERRG